MGNAAASGGVALDALAAITGGKRAVVQPGDPAGSLLIRMVTLADPARRMPKGGGPLPPGEISLLRRWIAAGAPAGGGAAGAGPSRPTTAKAAAAPTREVTLPTQAKLPPELAPAGKGGPPAAGALTLALTAPIASPVTALDFSPDGKLLAIGRYGRVTLWALNRAAPAAEIEEPGTAIHAVEFSPDGRWLAAGGGQPGAAGQVMLYDAKAQLRRVRTLEGHGEVVYGLAFSPDGKRLATASLDKTARVWSLPDGKLLLTLKEHSDFVYAVRFSPDGKHLLTGSVDRAVKVFDAATGKSQRTLSGHAEGILALAVSPDGKSAVSGGIDRGIRWWNLADGTSVRTLNGHAGTIYDLAWSRDGKRIASVSADKTVRLWDGASGAAGRTLSDSAELLYAVAISPDGRWVAAGSWDGLVRVWDSDKGQLRLTLLCGAAEHPTSAGEWLALTPEGFYDASAGLAPRVGWRAGDAPIAAGGAERIRKALANAVETRKALSGAALAAVVW